MSAHDPKRTFASPLLKRKYRENLVEHLLHDCIGSVLPSSEIVSLVHIVSVTLTFSRNLKGAGFGRRPFFAATDVSCTKVTSADERNFRRQVARLHGKERQ